MQRDKEFSSDYMPTNGSVTEVSIEEYAAINLIGSVLRPYQKIAIIDIFAVLPTILVTKAVDSTGATARGCAHRTSMQSPIPDNKHPILNLGSGSQIL